MNHTMKHPRILLSEHTANELAPQLAEIFGQGSFTHVTAKDILAGTADADISFVSRDITGNSTKQNILPATQYFYDALRASKDLKWLQIHSAGADRQVYLDLIARGVILTTSSGASASLVAQTALTGLLSLSRRFPQLAAAQRAHIWAPFFKTGLPPDLEGQTVMIVGWGPIGQKLGTWLGALGLNIIVVRQSAEARVEGARVISFAEFNATLPQTDWLVLACPLTAQTTNLVSAKALALIKSSAHIINISRGAVIDEPAMIDALKNDRLAGAYLDVFAQEPLAADSPLWDLPNVIATPHTAGFSDGILKRMSQMFIQNLKNWRSNSPLFNVVNK